MLKFKIKKKRLFFVQKRNNFKNFLKINKICVTREKEDLNFSLFQATPYAEVIIISQMMS